MSTHSFVGVQIGDLIRAVYVHHDGYLEGVGQDLQAYTTQEAVEELISHGDRSSLDDGYYRDRGEIDVDPSVYGSFDEFFEACDRSWGEYYYLFRDGVWYCGTTYGSSPLFRKLVPYAEAISVSS